MLRHIQKHVLQRTGGEKVLDIFGMGEWCRRFLSCEQCGTFGGLEGHVCNVYFAPLGVCLKMDIFFAMLIKTTPNHPSIFPQTSVVFVDSTRCFFVVLDSWMASRSTVERSIITIDGFTKLLDVEKVPKGTIHFP